MLNFNFFTKRINCSISRKNFKLSMDIVDAVDKIDAANWNLIADQSTIFLSLPYLTSIENSIPIEYRYITYFIDDQPVGIAIFQLTKLDKSIVNASPELSSTTSLKRKFIEKINLKMLVSGSLFNSGAPSYNFNENQMSNEDALEAITEGIRNILATEGCKNSVNVLLMKEFYAKTNKKENKFKDYSFAEFCLEPNMVLAIENKWKTYDDYLQNMTAKYRNKSTATYKKSANITTQDFSSEEIRIHASTIDQLYNQVYEKANFKLGKIEVSTFALMKAALEDNFIFKTYWYEDKMIGFSTGVIDQRELYANYIGLDYEYIKSHAIYQRILYDFVDSAISLGLQSLNLGRTAGEIKSTIGAKPKDSICYIRMKNSVSNHFLKPIVNSIENPTFSERHPFKKA